MREEIIKLINEKVPLSYSELLNILKCDNSELAQVIYTMEDNDIIKEGKLYYLIDGNKRVAYEKLLD